MSRMNLLNRRERLEEGLRMIVPSAKERSLKWSGTPRISVRHATRRTQPSPETSVSASLMRRPSRSSKSWRGRKVPNPSVKGIMTVCEITDSNYRSRAKNNYFRTWRPCCLQASASRGECSQTRTGWGAQAATRQCVCTMRRVFVLNATDRCYE